MLRKSNELFITSRGVQIVRTIQELPLYVHFSIILKRWLNRCPAEHGHVIIQIILRFGTLTHKTHMSLFYYRSFCTHTYTFLWSTFHRYYPRIIMSYASLLSFFHEVSFRMIVLKIINFDVLFQFIIKWYSIECNFFNTKNMITYIYTKHKF